MYFQVNGKTFDGHGKIIEDGGIRERDLIDKISTMMYKKYGWSDGLIVELSPL